MCNLRYTTTYLEFRSEMLNERHPKNDMHARRVRMHPLIMAGVLPEIRSFKSYLAGSVGLPIHYCQTTTILLTRIQIISIRIQHIIAVERNGGLTKLKFRTCLMLLFSLTQKHEFYNNNVAPTTPVYSMKYTL